LDVSGTGTFHTIRFADGTEMITSGAGGGMTSWDLSVTGDSVTITDGATVTFTGQGSITTTRNANTVIISGTAGGSDPTGTASGVAFFGDDNNLTESSKLVFTSGGRGELNIDNQTGIINITEIETTGSAITLDYGTAQLVRFVEGNFSDPIMVSFRNNGFGFRDGNPSIFSSTTTAAVTWQGFWGPQTNGGVDHGSSSKRWQDYYGYRMDLDNDTASSIVLKVQGAASQSANLQEWQNSTSVAQAHVDATGGISGTSYTFADGTIQTTAAAGGGGMTSWDLGVGTESVIDVTDGESVTFSGLNQITTTRTAQRIDIDVDLSNYYTISQVDTISGNLQTQIDANDNYQYWTITDGVNSENVSTTDTIKFTGGGDVGVSYNTSNNTVTISATAGGGGTPGGNSTEFQYNNGGSFAGTTGVVYGATNGTGTIFEVHGTGQPKDSLFSVSYTGVTTPTTVSIYNNDGQTANVFQVLTSGSGDLFTVSPTGKIYYNSSYSNIVNSGSIGSSMTFDLDTSNIFTGTLTTTSITLSTTNEDIGQRFMLRLKQDGTGGRTVGTWFGGRVSWPGGSAPTLSSSANLVDLFGFLVTSGSAGTFYYDGFTIATGIQ
jgi:hypothetical protein